MNLYKFSFLVLSLAFLASCSSDETPTNMVDPNDPSVIVWDGATISFTKENSTDPGIEANQDRIVDNVWITRGNDGGQIYNAAVESSANKQSSPAGTEWAEGSLDELNDLNFQPFRAAVGDPKNVVGKDLVLHLIEDNIYLSIRFTSWSQCRLGGFAYTRSTE